MLRKYAQVVVRKVGTHVSQNNVRWSIALAQLQSEHTWTTMLKFSEYQHTINCPMLAKQKTVQTDQTVLRHRHQGHSSEHPKSIGHSGYE